MLFYIRRTRPDKNGEAPIIMRITVNGLRVDAHTKKKVPPHLWSREKGRALEKNEAMRELNRYLDAVKLRIMKIHREMEIDGEFITAQSVLDRYLGKDVKNITLFELFREHNEKIRKLANIEVVESTVQKYETLLKHTEDFLWKTYRKKDIPIKDINGEFLQEYMFYFRTHLKISHNTAVKYMKNLKKIINIARSRGYIRHDPYTGLKFTLKEIHRDFLETHELQALIRKEFGSERISQVRDVFLFCCFTGLAYSDVWQLVPEHIYRDADGRYWIRKARQKTKNMCNIPLLDEALHIIEKYKDHPCRKVKGMLLPVSSNQKLNAYLKEIGEICGIRKQMTMHIARHTFATLTLANGVTLENVAKMLGHSDTKMTRHYAKILDSSIMRDMRNVQTKISAIL